ncbi:MAG: transporter [Gaiellaceae bacterium]|nr:transporter [Gaiellaceae bacterium]
MTALAPLRHREFRLLFTGRATTILGSAMAPVALAFAVLDITGSKTDLGLVLAARALPQLLFLLVGGIWADRLPRHRVMVASDLVSGASQAAVAALLITGNAEIWHLVAFGIVNGTSTAFFFPASQGIVPQTVPPGLLQQANALLRLVLNGSFIGGAALGGLLVAAFGSGTAIAIDSVTFFAGAVFIGAMRLPASLRLESTSFLVDLAVGWKEFRARTWLWVIVLQFSFVNAVESGALYVLGPVVAEEELGGARDWGLIVAAQAVGMVAGGLMGLRFQPRRMLLAATLAILLMPGVLVTLGFPLALPAIVGAAFLAGVGIEMFSILWDTTMQQQIPGEMLSRLYSYDMVGSLALVPIGYAVAGPVAEVLGVQTTLWAAAGVAFAATLPVLLVRDVQRLERKPVLEPVTSSP